MRAGDCIIGRQDRFVKYYSDKDMPYIKLWFSATGKYIDNLFDSFGFTSAVTVATVDMQSQFEVVISDLENGKCSLFDMSHRILDIFFAVYSNNNKIGERREKLSDVKHIKSYIDTYLNSDVSLEKIAMHFNTSVKKVIEVFKREMGMTPHKYIKEERLRGRKANARGNREYRHRNLTGSRLLRAELLSAEFKKAFGLYPTEYRKAFREQTDIVKYRNFGISADAFEKEEKR